MHSSVGSTLNSPGSPFSGGGGGLPPGAGSGPSSTFDPIGKPSNSRFYVTIPACAVPGEHFAVLVNGQQMMAMCPLDKGPGDRIIIHSPRKQLQQYVVIVPDNVSSGQSFRATIGNQEVSI